LFLEKVLLTESAAPGPLRERLEALLSPVLAAMGYELICVEHQQGGRQRVRLYIDRPEGIGLEDCEQVSRQTSAVLDVNDLIPGEYVLEVSSPGDDRPLVRPDHFSRFVGHRIRVRTLVPLGGRRNFTGTLVEATPESINIDHDGQPLTLRLDQLDMARLAPHLETASPSRGSK
jgi:ribosome maturation factor RimP